MATRPAVAGLVKHQLYWRDPFNGAEQGAVQTFWTWKNHDPVPQARIDYEAAALAAWAKVGSLLTYTSGSSWATFVKSWDMGQTPPSRYAPLRIWPVAPGAQPSTWFYQLTMVIALRTQPVGSSERNRQNGRLYHPYFGGAISSGVWTTGDASNLAARYQTLVTTLNPATNANSGTWVVPSFFEAGVLRPGGPLLPAVNHVIGRRVPAVVRSRLRNQAPYALGS